MSVDRGRVKEIFFEASELPRAGVSPFLDSACAGDAALRAEVESLLGHHNEEDLIAEPGPTRIPEAQTGSHLPAGDRYRPLSELGRGGFGRVVRSFDRSLRRVVATKESVHEDPEFERALLHEARLLAYLDHPGVVQVFDVRRDERVSYTMKLLSGESLHARLKRSKVPGRLLPVSEAVRIVTRVAETMANAHDKGVLHLDLKPANIMLESWGQVSVIDWGISRFFDTDRYENYLQAGCEFDGELFPEASGVAGTPAYMPPEQFRGVEAGLRPTADIYSVGTILFELLTGLRPFAKNANLAVLALQKQTAKPPEVRPIRPDVSERLEALCMRMLEPDPTQRPQSFGEVLQELGGMADFGAAAAKQRMEDGEILFEQGDVGRQVFQVLEGALESLVADERVAWRGPGEIVGELALLSERPRTATARASGPTVVRALDQEGLESELRKVNPLIGQLLRALSDKLVDTTLDGGGL